MSVTQRVLTVAGSAIALVSIWGLANQTPAPVEAPSAPVPATFMPARDTAIPPPGWAMTFIPSARYGGTIAVAASWCEGTTRVHSVTTDDAGGGTAQDLERNAVTCGGTGTQQ